MTKTKRRTRAISLLLALLMVLTLLPLSAQAASVGDGSKSCTMTMVERNYYLSTTAGTRLGASAYVYKTNDGLTGPAFCIDHGLNYTAKTLPITGKYTSSPKTAAAFAGGYPQFSVDTFLGVYLAANPILAGLTESEYAYATQIAVWATLGQLAVDGTSFSQGRERLARPTGDKQQSRIFCAAQLILLNAASWDRVYETGMYIRLEDALLGGNISIPGDMTLDFAADNQRYGLKREVIGGISYYTREYIFASATSTYYSDYNIELWADNAPAGTIFVDTDNRELGKSTFKENAVWSLPVEYTKTALNTNGFEYSGTAKLCIPVDTVPNSGEITINCGAYVMQYEIYLAYNETSYEQSYIIADPSKGTQTANAVLNWGGIATETGKLQVIKTGGGGEVLSNAVFTLTGTDGSSRIGTTNADGTILWEELNPDISYTLTETKAPAGYALMDPINVQIEAARTNYVTVRNTTEKQLTVHKVDKQNGYSLAGATIRFEQIDGSFRTDKVTDHAGNISMTAEELPIGSYKVYEITAPEGYEMDSAAQTVNWDGRRNITLSFENTRKPTLIIYKCDEGNNYNLPGATFEVYKNGQLITTVTTNDNGLAYVHGITTGYYTVKETAAPEGYVLDSSEHSVYIDLYDPATADDPRLVITNAAKPDLEIVKTDAVTGEPVAGVSFKINKADGSTLTTVATGADGKALVEDLDPGVYTVTETSVPGNYLLNETPQSITLAPNKTGIVQFQNYPKPGLTINKVDSITGDPIKGARFHITYASNNTFSGELNDLGYFHSDENGKIELTNLKDGWYRVTEVEPAAGYAIKDTGTQDFYLDAGAGKIVTFENTPLSALIIKKVDADSGAGLQGAKFRVRYLGGTSGTGGTIIGEYTTSANGTVVITDLKAGTYIVEETKAPSGYEIDDAPQTVYLSGKEQDVITVEFADGKHGNLIVEKIDSVTKQPLAGAQFKIIYSDGSFVANYGGSVSSNGIYTTDENGQIHIVGIRPGSTLVVTETKAPDGYIMDSAPQTVKIEQNDTQTLTFTNTRTCSLLIHKTDATTGKGIYGVTFVLYDGDKNPIAQVTTDQDGYAYINNELTSGLYYVREIQAADGYIADSQYRTVYIKAGTTTSIEWKNSTITGQIQITKYAAADNSVTGEAAGTRLRGAVFEIARYKSGVVVDYIVTDARGVAASGPLPLGRYIVREVTAPAYYQLSGQDFDVDVEFAGQIVRLAAYNMPAELGVSITKSGNKEVLAGSSMIYRFTVANTSNVALGSFYWHDRIPTDAAVATALITGTYSQRLNYRVLYKTNYNDYRVLASNLLSTQNYSYALTALPLMSGEVITDIYFDFGTVPAGFQSKTNPMLAVTVGGNVANGYNVINRADVGGRYQGTWETANARWVTIVRKLTPAIPLPKTGY